MGRNQKYNSAFKLQCVEAVLKEHRSVHSVAEEHGFNESNLRLWIGFYEAYGAAGLEQKRNQCYNPAFKINVLQTMDKEFLSLRAASVRFNIPSESVIINWRRAYETNGVSGLANGRRGRPKKIKMSIKRKPRKTNKPLTREEELLLEIESLKAENELLKKLQALTQTKKKQKP